MAGRRLRVRYVEQKNPATTAATGSRHMKTAPLLWPAMAHTRAQARAKKPPASWPSRHATHATYTGTRLSLTPRNVRLPRTTVVRSSTRRKSAL